MEKNCISQQLWEAIEIKLPFVAKKGGDEYFREQAMKVAKKMLAKNGIYLCNSNHRTLAEVLEYLIYLTADRGYWKVSINAIAEEIGVCRNTVSRLVKKLEEAKIITKFYFLKGNKRDMTIFLLNLHGNYFEFMNILKNAEDVTSALATEIPHYVTPCFQSGTRKKSSRFKGKRGKKRHSYLSDSSNISLNKDIYTPESVRSEPKISQSSLDWVDGRSA